MKLRKLLEEISILSWKGNQEENIQGITYSSAQIGEHYLFAALKGEKTDGHQFIPEALKKGAKAILSERPVPDDFPVTWIQVKDAREALGQISANFYGHPYQEMKMVGITGTKGKTTTAYLLEAILKKAHFHPAVTGTISYRGPGLNKSAQRTTPEAPDLHRVLREVKEKGATHCIMEVSSHSLELKRVVGINFDLAIFTNLSGEHIDYHQSMEKYFEAKKKLFTLNKKGMAVVNLDDPWGKKLVSQLPRGTITYGLQSKATVRAQNFYFNHRGISISVQYPGGKLDVFSPLLGKPNASNVMASVATALTLNIPLYAIKEGVTSLRGIPGRMEKIDNSQGFLIFVDYAHTDAALRNLLETARGLNPSRVILVFGAGGDRDKTKRPRMGKIAVTWADWTILTSDNPRSENPLTIISDIQKGIQKTGKNNYQIQPDRKEAIRQALYSAKPGDCILIAGKGHENYQIIKDKVIHFNDGEVVREILKGMEVE